MFCQKCGKEIPGQARFCPKCGAAISNAANGAPPAAREDSAAADNPGEADNQALQPRKPPGKRGVPRRFLIGFAAPFALLCLSWEALTRFTAACGPFLGAWTETADNVVIRLPIALLAVLALRRVGKPDARPRTALSRKATAKLVALFTLAVCVPVHLLMHAPAAAAAGTATGNIAEMLTGALVVAPVLEEILHRGALFGLSRRALGFWPAALFCAALFQIGHPTARHALLTIPLAVATSAVYDATGRLKYGMYMHFAMNAVTFLTIFIDIPFAAALPVYIAAMALLALACARREAFLNRINQ